MDSQRRCFVETTFSTRPGCRDFLLDLWVVAPSPNRTKYLLHDFRGQGLLVWKVQPGDTVLAHGETEVHEEGEEKVETDGEGKVVSASLKHVTLRRVGAIMLYNQDDEPVQALSVLGRPVTLGEDGAEEAFGRDAVEEAKKEFEIWGYGGPTGEGLDLRPWPCELKRIEQ